MTYTLPLKALGPPSHLPTRQELGYLAGFFDGDGYVSMVREYWTNVDGYWPNSGFCQSAHPLP